MKVMKLFLLLLSVIFVNAWRRGMDNRQNEPSVLKPDPYTRYYTEQTLDHFDGTNAKTWKQRYFVNETFWDGTGAVFLCVGGEGPPLQPNVVVTGDVHCADMVDLAPKHKALIVAVEHRYYGESIPTPDFTTENLKWLSSQQALADLAQIRGYLADIYKMTDKNKWVSWGGSYPGMLAAWFRLKYPHLVWAAVSSSAPVRAEANMQGYNDVVGQALGVASVGGSQDCIASVKTAFATIGQQLYTASGRRALETQFKICAPDALENVNNQRQFTEQLSYLFPAQSNDPACTTLGCNISSVCSIMLNPANGETPQDRLAYLNSIKSGPCTAVNYQLTLAALADTSVKTGVMRIWFYQTCTEFAFYQTCDPDSQCIFTSDPWLNTLESNYELCKFAFDVGGSQTEARVNFSNQFYGSDQIAGTRILSVNGEIDPWHANAVLQSLSPDEPALWVEGASHHYWTHPQLPTDTPQVNQARQQIWDQVTSWLNEPY